MNFQFYQSILCGWIFKSNYSTPKFELQLVCEQSVYDLLRQLKVNKAIGLDEISPRLLKDSAHVITPSLTQLFNRSLANKKFLSIWKKGKVSPLFKSGDGLALTQFTDSILGDMDAGRFTGAVFLVIFGILIQ